MQVKKIVFGIVAICLSLMCFFNVFAVQIINTTLKYDGKEHAYNASEINIMINGDLIEEYNTIPVILNSRTLVPARDVFEKLQADISWNEATKEVTVKRNNDIIILTINNKVGIKNGVSFEMDTPPKIINDYTMIPVRAVSEALDCEVQWNDTARLISIYDIKDKTTTEITTKAVTETTTEITTKAVTETTTNSSIINTSDNTVSKKQNGITIVWDQIGNAAANSNDSKKIPIDGLNVISPTWFEISNNSGDIYSKADEDYVTWAHNQGYEVWALFSNGFDATITHNTLSNPEIRTKMINKISEYVDTYNLDGINIDFESVAKADGEYYVQFIREITPVLKAKDIVVSVDMYIPTVWTEHYDMKTVGTIVDYVIIMAYDEHYSTSKVSGSVASKGWVDTAMSNACDKVDKNKLIMGVPFYTRKWTEKTENGQISVSSASMTMENAYKDLIENNANIVWDDECGQYYGEYILNGVTYKIWLEDEKSIEEKMKIARKYDVLGVAAWKRGFEKEGIWDIINKYF